MATLIAVATGWCDVEEVPMKRILGLALVMLLAYTPGFAVGRRGCSYCNSGPSSFDPSSCDAADQNSNGERIANCSVVFFCYAGGPGWSFCEYQCQGDQCFQV
jgi:hypothetical protein